MNELDESFRFDMKMLSSSHINFLFGSGVNGKAFPQFKDFKRTLAKLKQFGAKKDNLEEALNEITSEKKRKKVLEVFKNELVQANSSICYDNPSISNLKSLFESINEIVKQSENRTNSMKQINIYTLNYDCIVENSLKSIGLIANQISSSNIDDLSKLFNIVAYDYSLKKYIPTYLISKIHGDMSNPVLPGANKYDDVLQAKRFELLFKMKEHLSRSCSILFVIGYSGNDKHINNILLDCLKAGLTLYWISFSKDNNIPSNLLDEQVFFIKGDGATDSTSLLAERIKRSWEIL